MTLTEQQKSALKNFIQSPQWQIVMAVIEDYINQVNSRSALQDTDWETLKQTCLKEGEVRGIRNLVQEIFNLIQ